MTAEGHSIPAERLSPFDRNFFGSAETATRIGKGSIGGKASGLVFIKDAVAAGFPEGAFEGISIDIPRFVVIATDFFDRFMQRNGIDPAELAEKEDERIAHVFQRAELPAEIVGDLRALISSVNTPLAIRSSSRLEDAMFRPFAGVYGTKMIPNNQASVDVRFQRLVEAVKYVFASTFFRGARDYACMVGRDAGDEKMAVVIQEVIGTRHNDRYYPQISGVARSYNYYPAAQARPEEGVVDLALGLGKTIVDGGLAWSYSPAYPRVGPPVGSPRELMKRTQGTFWAINMGRPPEHDPIKETEYLVEGNLSDAELDGTLRHIASTYRPQDDRIVMGTGFAGPRVITFEQILRTGSIPLNELLKDLLKRSGDAMGCAVEIEFAMTLDARRGLPARFGFLQVRPMVVSDDTIEIESGEMDAAGVLAASDRVLGNGRVDDVRDVVYVRPDDFDAGATRAIAAELAGINRRLVSERTPYLLIGFGRWGSSDPWLGIPVEWSQISGAKVIVEATLPDMDVELSQGSHFFHNISSFQVLYFSVHHAGRRRIDWGWLEKCDERDRTAHVTHVRLDEPLSIKVDGRSGQGVIRR